MKKTLIIIGSTILFVLSIEFLLYTLSNKDKKYAVKEFRKSGYKMINPVLDFYELEPVLVREVRALQSEISDYRDEVIAQNKVKMISIYFRDLNNGPWIGIGEDELYAPASLLKVPVLIAGLKKAEEEPDFLLKKLLFTPLEKNASRNITDNILLVPGRKYTIDELLQFMIIHSDNDAIYMLVKEINKEKLHDIYYDLGIPFDSFTNRDFLTVKEYASYFRILYNATYLNRKMSEKALTILSKTTFNQGIVAGVPKGVVVAHKFGERHFASDDITQLHDCGIVYKEKKPYLVCIMARGTNIDTMANVISNVSAIIYNSEATKPN